MNRRWLKSIIAHSGDPHLIAVWPHNRSRGERLARALTLPARVGRA